MSEVRTTSSTGGQKGVKPERHDLIPRKAMAWIARVFGFGAEKYEDHNWRRGYEWGKSLASLQRHIDEFVEGNSYDEESGLPHLAHAGFHILALLTWFDEQGEGPDNLFDDRWMHSMERARRALEGGPADDTEAAVDKILAERQGPVPTIPQDEWLRSEDETGAETFIHETPPKHERIELDAGTFQQKDPVFGIRQEVHIHAIDEKARRAEEVADIAIQLQRAINDRGVGRENLRF